MTRASETAASDRSSFPSKNARYPKSSRLRHATEFKRVFERPRRFGDRAFTLLVRANSIGRPRLGMAIAKKKARTSVARNRIKRLVRESFRNAEASLPDIDIVVMLRDGAIARENHDLLAELGMHWSRLAEGPASELGS